VPDAFIGAHRGDDGSFAPLSWIGDERIAIGGRPAAGTVALLPGLGVTHVVNCRARAQVTWSRDLAAERAVFGADRVAHAPMWDLGRPQQPRLWAHAARFAARTLDEDPKARILIHCHRGRHRSAMLAYAVLRLRGRTDTEAAALVLTHRPGAELMTAYVRSVEQWLTALPI
jgi:protein-tyrosine phosphatase